MSRIDELLRGAADQWRSEVDARAGHEHERRASAAYLRRARRRRMLRRWPVQLAGMATVVAAVLLGAWLVHQAYDPQPPSPGGSGAGCAAPVLRIGHGARPTALVRGERVTVTGWYYINGCNDYPGAEPAPPMASVRLTLTPRGGRPIVLATAHPAGELGTFRITIAVPTDAPTGPGRLDGGLARGLPVVVR